LEPRKTAESKEGWRAGMWRWRTPLLIGGAVLSLAIVLTIGLFQFKHQAARPVSIVKGLRIHGTDVTIGQGILDFLKSTGTKVVNEGFKPTWGAEQTGGDRWVVSFVFEVGRQSHWASWVVNTRTGSVTPRDELARRIQQGK